jgi:hypothetical protein
MAQATPEQGRRAGNLDEIRPLVALCKAGRLFEVQRWIARGSRRATGRWRNPQEGSR